MDKVKIRNQIKEYQAKVLELRKKLKAVGVVDEGGVGKLNDAIVKGGPNIKTLIAQGLAAKKNRKAPSSSSGSIAVEKYFGPGSGFQKR